MQADAAGRRARLSCQQSGEQAQVRLLAAALGSDAPPSAAAASQQDDEGSAPVVTMAIDQQEPSPAMVLAL